MRNIHHFLKRFALPAIVGCLPLFAFGQTTEINDEAGLRAIANDLSGSYKLTADITLTGNWEPLGEFKGILDGDGHVIYGLRIDQSGTRERGFFHHTADDAIIRKLGFENAYVNGNENSGVIVGYMKKTLIDECYVANSYVEGRDHVGALVGQIEGGGGSLIRNSYANAQVYSRDWQAGGLVGVIDYGDSKISKCYFSGIVRCNGGRTAGISSLSDRTKPTIEYSVNLAPYILGPNNLRIYGGNDGDATLTDNYSLASSIGSNDVNGWTSTNTVPVGDPNLGTDKRHGDNIPNGDENAKTSDFYVETLGWDFTNVWTFLGTGAYPVLKWQAEKTPVKVSVLNLNSPYALTDGATLDLSTLVSSNGLDLAFSTESNVVTISPEKVVSVNPEAALPATITINIALVGGNSNFQLKEESLELTVFPSGAIEIGTAEDLFLWTIQYPSVDYRLTADLDLSGTEFPGIGTAEKPFSGTFDGNGHVIYGAVIENAANRNIGLFRITNGATIKKLGVENARFIGNEDVGGIVGRADGVTTIEECYVANSYIEGRDHAGAITGGLNDGSIIRNCYASARVHSREHQAGGLTGTLKKGLIENAYFSGLVTNVGGRSVGVGGYHDDGGNQTPENIQIRKSVNLSQYILSSDQGARYRIFDNGGDRQCVMADNYSLNTSQLGKPDLSELRTIPEDDSNYGENKRHGADVSLEDARTQTFYQTTLGWDFTGIWKMVDGAYPVLKWQSDAPLANSFYTFKDNFLLIADETVEDLGKYIVSSHGLDWTFAPAANGKVSLTDDGNAAINGDVEAWTKDTISAVVAGSSVIAAASVDMRFTLFPDADAVIAIADEEQLDILHQKTYGDYILTANITLTNDWTPAGTFTGTFDGQGHILTGLKYEASGSNDIGLFSYAKNATIKRLGLKDARFVGNNQVGAIVGTAENTLIQECFVEGSYVEASDRAGAIAGVIRDGTTIENSYAASSDLKGRVNQVGGLVGASREATNGTLKISNTYFEGTVTGGSNRACGILALVDSDAEILIENTVNLASSITGGNNRYRIADAGGRSVLTLANNYSLAATIVGNAPLPTDDGNYGADKTQGANIPEGDENAKSQEFYETTLEWDFDNTWLMIDEGNAYPVLSIFYGDATLSALSVEEGDISPAFNAATTEYTLEVENVVENVTVHATPNQEGATVVIDGGTDLVVGENTVTITVTAQNSVTQDYTITVTRKDRDVSIADVKAQEVIITAAEGRIQAQFEGNASVKLYSVTGQLIDESVAVNNYDQSVKQGVYILSVQNKAYKVVVK
jgi:hypothetical protein